MESSPPAHYMPGPATHAKAFFASSIGAHPTATAALIGVLVLGVLVLGFLLMKAKKAPAAPAASGFLSPTGHMAGNHAHWQLGNADAGNGGSVHRDITPSQAAVFHPAARGKGASCGAWSPDASAEAQALATVGSLSHDAFGERALQGAINSAYDGASGSAGAVDDLTLAAVMHSGGSP